MALPHHAIVVPAALVAAILAVWGISLQRDAFRARGGSPLRWFDPRRWIVDTFPYWLGATMLGDAAVYAVLAIATLREQTIDLWAAALFIAVAFPAIQAMRHWMRDRTDDRA